LTSRKKKESGQDLAVAPSLKRGKGQGHRHLLEPANGFAQTSDQVFANVPACSLNARGRKLTDRFAPWNVVTHGD
jgi:hypothetical protein